MASLVVVDDDDAIRNWLAAVLRAANHAVRTYASAELAVPGIRGEIPDLIVTDIRLPGMSGLEMLELLRRDGATATVPLILITSVGHRQIHRQGMELGADDFITKPLSAAEVTQAVEARLVRARSAAAAERTRALPAEASAMPAHIGRFRIEKRLARGPGGELFLGCDAAGVRAAVKVMTEAGGSDDRLRRFLREIEIAGAVRHPNLATVLERGIADAGPFVAFEYFQLGDLADMLSRAIAPHLAFRIVSQVAAGLGALHAAGIIHRDIKPANIMVRNAHSYVVTDFGTAKLLEGDVNVTDNGRVVGTPTYVSPEQITRKPLGPSTDIYSLGVVLYELLTGQKPFAGIDYHEVLQAHLAEVPAPLPVGLAAFQPVVSRMLAKLPAQRHADTDELLREISRLAF